MGYKAPLSGGQTTTPGPSNIISLLFNNPYFQLGYAGVEFFLNKKKAEKARERAREQQAENNAFKIDGLLTDSGKDIPYLVGRNRALGLVGYAIPGNNIPWVPSEALPNVFGALENLDGRQKAPRAGTNEEYVLVQTVESLGECEITFAVLLDEQNIDSRRGAGGIRGAAIAEIGVGGTASELATRFDAGHGDISGNGLGERDADSKWTPVAYTTRVFRNASGVETAKRFTAFPKGENIGEYNAPRLIAGGVVQNVKSRTYASPLVLAEIWQDTAIGLGRPASELGLDEWPTAVAISSYVMQGRNGLWEEAYPARMNTIDGTNYAKYKDAFIGKGFVSYEDTTQQYNSIADSSDPGPETGWGDKSIMIGENHNVDDFRILRHQCHGALYPTKNPSDLIAHIMFTMPGSKFFKRVSDGKYVLRHVLKSKNSTGPSLAVLRENDFDASEPPREITNQSEIDSLFSEFRNSDKNSIQSGNTFPREDSHAATAVLEQTGKTPNKSSAPLPLCDNKYHAENAGYSEVTRSKLRSFLFKTMPGTRFWEPTDKLTIYWDRLGLENMEVIVEAQIPREDMSQNLVFSELEESVEQWRVAQREGVEPERYEPPTVPVPGIPLLEVVGRTIVVELDSAVHTVTRDPDGNPTENQPLTLQEIGSQTWQVGDSIYFVLPAIRGTGSEDALLSVSGLPAGLTFASDTRVVSGTATTSMIGEHTVTVSIDGTTVSRTFVLEVEALSLGRIKFDAPSPHNEATGNLRNNGDVSLLFLDRGFGTLTGLNMIHISSVRNGISLQQAHWEYRGSSDVVFSDPDGLITGGNTIEGDWRQSEGNAVNFSIANPDLGGIYEITGELSDEDNGRSLSRLLRIHIV